jgi:hypothetical protein
MMRTVRKTTSKKAENAKAQINLYTIPNQPCHSTTWTMTHIAETWKMDLNKFAEYKDDKFKDDVFRKNWVFSSLTPSAQYNNKPWNSNEAAMLQVPGYIKPAVYYIFKQCKEHPDLHSHFAPFLNAT